MKSGRTGKNTGFTVLLAVVCAMLSLAVAAPTPAPAGVQRSCGAVSVPDAGRYKLTIIKGSPSCRAVRRVAKEWPHPLKVAASCHPVAHECEYGVYRGGWRCTGLFQGNFGCWLGGDSKGQNSRASFGAAPVAARKIEHDAFGAASPARSVSPYPELARKRHQIYFWANLGDPVSTPVHGFHNPFVVRPRVILLFVDGQWVLERLNWTGWGSAVAKATGKSSSSDGDPNAAEGKRIITWAKVTLYDPGVFHGHRVYRCVRIQVPPPANWGTGCLQRAGSSVGLSPPGSGTPVGVGAEAPEPGPTAFLSADHEVFCGFDSIIHQVSCGTRPEPPTYSGTLHASGKVEICSVPKLEYTPGSVGPPLGCYQQWEPDFEHFPTLGLGESTSFGGFRCTSAEDGITCVKASGAGKGQGFRVDKDESVEVGG
jgi:hypothetical protein